METLETISRRLASIQDLQDLVRSMKRLSAMALIQLDRAENSLRRFQATIDLGFQVVLRQYPVRAATTRQDAGTQVVIVMGSDRGLCGAFNETVANLAERHVRHATPRHLSHYILAVGQLAAARLTSMGTPPDDVMQTAGTVHGLSETCERILIQLDTLQRSRNVTSVAIVYNDRDENAQIKPRAHVLLPLATDRLQQLAQKPWPTNRLPGFSVDHDALFFWLVRQHLLADLYNAGLTSMAAENAARLFSMQRAERNISDMQEELGALFRRLRQDAITNELMDIVGGYEVLRNSRDRTKEGGE